MRACYAGLREDTKKLLPREGSLTMRKVSKNCGVALEYA